MSNLDRMKAAAKAGKPVAVPPPAPKAKKEKPAPGPQVTYQCGHKKTLPWFLGTACAECRNKTKRATAEKRRAEQAAKRDAKQATANAAARLPDGAVFEVRYDATTQAWSGTLTVNGLAYTGTASGVFKLLASLDAKYRAG